MKKTCKQCGREFERPQKLSITQWRKQEYCGRQCFFLHSQKRVTKVCLHCGKEFVVPLCRDKKAFYCSLVCKTIDDKWKEKAKINRIPVKGEEHPRWSGGKTYTIYCENCGKESKNRYKSDLSNRKHFFCSNECAHEYVKLPLEVKRDHQLEYDKRYREKNLVKLAYGLQDWYKTNNKKVRQRVSEYHYKNQEQTVGLNNKGVKVGHGVGNKWSNDEIEYLKKHWGNTHPVEIAKYLKRTFGAICTRAWILHQKKQLAYINQKIIS